MDPSKTRKLVSSLQVSEGSILNAGPMDKAPLVASKSKCKWELKRKWNTVKENNLESATVESVQLTGKKCKVTRKPNEQAKRAVSYRSGTEMNVVKETFQSCVMPGSTSVVAESVGQGQSSDGFRSCGLQPLKSQLNIDTSCYVGLDCEFVGVGPRGCRSALGRCSIVDYYGNVVADIYAQPEDRITDYRTRWSGIRKHHLKSAIPFDIARQKVKQILKDKIVVGHSVHNDFKVLGILHPADLIRDTASCPELLRYFGMEKGQVSLKRMSERVLHRRIQIGSHCSVEDSQATIALFRHVQKKWEKRLRSENRVVKQTRCRTISVDDPSIFLNDNYWPDEHVVVSHGGTNHF